MKFETVIIIYMYREKTGVPDKKARIHQLTPLRKRADMQPKEEQTCEMLRRLEQNQFYGSIELKFEAGHVVLVRKTETIKPSSYRENRGEHNEQQ